MTLQQLRAFVNIVKCGSFRQAARESGLSQAGLTGSLKALETSLGTALLQRSARGTSLTHAGERLLPRAQLIVHEAQRAFDDLAAAASIGGTLHVGLGPTPTAALLPLVVPDFHASHPGVRLKLSSGFPEQLQPALQNGQIELAITALPETPLAPGLTTRHLFWSKLVVVVRKGHPLTKATSLRDLEGYEWVLLGSPGGPGSSILRVYADHHLNSPPIAATCESITQLAALITATDWLALLPSILVERGLLGVPIDVISVREKTSGSDNSLIYRADTPLSRPAAAFAAMCESCARVLVKLSAGATR